MSPAVAAKQEDVYNCFYGAAQDEDEEEHQQGDRSIQQCGASYIYLNT